MLGSPEPTTLDCCVFGMLDKLLEPEVRAPYISSKYPTLFHLRGAPAYVDA